MEESQYANKYFVTGGGGTRLYVEEAGNPNGIPILFIHGFNQSRHSWIKQFQSNLTEQFRLIALDNRGHGLSEKPQDAYHDPKRWADDIHSIITSLELDNVMLVGWSFGGIIILDYLHYYGEEKIKGIHLVGARTRIGVLEAAKETGEEYSRLKSQLTSDDAHESVQAIERFMKLCTYKALPEQEHYFILGFNTIVPPYVRKGLLSRSISYNDLLATLKTPVLITHGVEDKVVLFSHAKHNANRIPHAQTSFYENVGHSPFREDASRFNEELKHFILSLE